MLIKIFAGKSGPTLLDQTVVSAGNFLTALVLARTLTPTNYGTFSLMFIALFAINTCHSSLVVYPLTLRGAELQIQDLGRLTGLAIIQTVALALPLSMCLSIFVIALHRIDLILPLILAMVAWQLQETTRRALLSAMRASAAILPDALCYLGQGVLILAFRPHSLQSIFFLIAGTSLIAAAWQGMLVRLSFRGEVFPNFREYGRYSWKMGRFILAGNALNSLGLQVPSWALAFSLGPLGVAGYQSLLNLVGVANPVIFSANNLLIPAIVRAAPLGVAEARKTAVRYGATYGAILVPCFLVLLVVPQSLMQLTYGSHAVYISLAPLLRPFAAAFALQYLATVIGAYEGGMSRPQTYMWVQIVSITALLIVGIPLILSWGIKGAVYAMVVASSVRLFVFGLIAWSEDRRALSRAASPNENTSVLPVGVVKEPEQVCSSVQVCVLTYRRPEQLRQTLESLAVQTLARSSPTQVSVLVVDNDGGSALSVVNDLRARVDMDLRYIPNSRNGLSTGRNLALDNSWSADFVAFIDDDEIADPDWLEQLVHAALRFSADVVTGPVLPDHVMSPSWVVHGRFFEPPQSESGKLAIHIATNNTLIGSRVVRGVRFDPEFDETGGEDTDYFLRVRQAGFRMIWCEEARVVEKVPLERANLKWLLRRAYSDANRFTRSKVRLDRSKKVLLRRLCVGTGGLLAGCVLIPTGILGRHRSVRGLQLIARAAGTFAGLGGSSPTYYGRTSNVSA